MTAPKKPNIVRRIVNKILVRGDGRRRNRVRRNRDK